MRGGLIQGTVASQMLIEQEGEPPLPSFVDLGTFYDAADHASLPATYTFNNFALGTPHASRVLVMGIRMGTAAAGFEGGEPTGSMEDADWVVTVTPNAGSPVVLTPFMEGTSVGGIAMGWLFHGEVPLGTEATITITHPAGSIYDPPNGCGGQVWALYNLVSSLPKHAQSFANSATAGTQAFPSFDPSGLGVIANGAICVAWMTMTHADSNPAWELFDTDPNGAGVTGPTLGTKITGEFTAQGAVAILNEPVLEVTKVQLRCSFTSSTYRRGVCGVFE